MILQTTNHIDYFLISLLLSPLVIFLLIKIVFHIFNKRHLNKGVTTNLLHLFFSIIIAALLFYAYDSFGVHIADQYLANQEKYFCSNEVNSNNYKEFPWHRKLVQHDGFYMIDEKLTFETDSTIKLFNAGIFTDNWLTLKYIFNINDGQGSNTYNIIRDSLYVSTEHNLFGDTVFFYYNDSLKLIETDLYY